MRNLPEGDGARSGKTGEPAEKKRPIHKEMAQNIEYVQQALYHSSDLMKREVTVQDAAATLLYLEPMTDRQQIQDHVIRPLAHSPSRGLDELLTSLELNKETDLEQGIACLVRGECLLFVDGRAEYWIVGAAAICKRDIVEPQNEGVIRGPHYGFNEQLSVNLYLIRKQIQNPRLIVHYRTSGRSTHTRIAMVYMQDLANPELVREVERRMDLITSDMVLSPGFIQEFTEDNPYSPFPQHLNTERPDRAAANLMEGRVLMMAEGDPTALIVPATFFSFYQTPDDYNSRWIVGSLVRFIRMISFLFAFLLPAFYIATVSFHADILPNELVHTIKSSLERIPFPPLVEAMLLEIIFELLREAGIRLPSRVGQTIGIVGGLVIGDAIVRAGFVSYTMIIVVALTAISSFLVPSSDMSQAVRVLRFPMMIFAAMFGYVGISFGLMIVFIHLCKLDSYGVPYFSPLAPLRFKDMKDTIIRFPLWSMKGRPHDLRPKRWKQLHEREGRGSGDQAE